MTQVKAALDDWGGLAWFSGVVIVVRPPASLVSSLLPAPLRANDAAADPTREGHPLVFVLGELRDGGAHVAGRAFSAGIRYREAAVLIPGVRHVLFDGDALFACAMFADDLRPVLLGNAAYGFRKRQARIEWSGPTYDVDVDGQTCLVARGALGGNWQGTRDGFEPPRWLEDLSASPMLGRRATGDYVLSRFSWDFGAAAMCALEVELRWRPVPGTAPVDLHAGEHSAIAIRDMLWKTSRPATLG
jgi:hypothetical protein